MRSREVCVGDRAITITEKIEMPFIKIEATYITKLVVEGKERIIVAKKRRGQCGDVVDVGEDEELFAPLALSYIVNTLAQAGNMRAPVERVVKEVEIGKYDNSSAVLIRWYDGEVAFEHILPSKPLPAKL